MLNFLIKPIWIFGIDRTVQNLLGESTYGIYFALLNFTFLLNILLDFGINNYNNRNVARDETPAKLDLPLLSGIRILLGGFFFVAVLIFGYLLGYLQNHSHLLLPLAFNQFLLACLLFLRSNISGMHLFRWDALLSVTDRVIMIGIMTVILLSSSLKLQLNIEWFIYVQTIGYAGSCLLAIGLLSSKKVKLFPVFRFSSFVPVLKKSAPYALLILLMTVYYRVDAVMLEQMLPDGDFQAGIYAQSFRLLDAVNVIGYLLAGLLLPIFARMLGQNEDVSQLAQTGTKLIWVPALALATICWLYHDWIMAGLYTSLSPSSAEILPILISCFVPMSMVYVFGTLLTANGSLKRLNQIAGITLILNIALNIVLIPELEARGAAIASLSTQVFGSVIQVIIAVKVLKVNLTKPLQLRLVAFALACVGTFFLFTKLNLQPGIGIVTCILTLLVISICLGLTPISEALQLVKQKTDDN